MTKTIVRLPLNDVIEAHHLFVIEAPMRSPAWREGHLFVNDKGHETAMCSAYV